MKYRGIPSCSVEINPYLHFVGTVKTRTYADWKRLQDAFRSFVTAARRELCKLPDERQSEAYLAENAQFVPSSTISSVGGPRET